MKHRLTHHPPEVGHAFDYFTWAMLDDIALFPIGPRPYGDDERQYNATLNAHFFKEEVKKGELTSDATETARDPYTTGYVPDYFPDLVDGMTLMTAHYGITKHSLLGTRVQYRVQMLEGAAGSGWPLADAPADARAKGYLVRPDGFLGYYESLRERGILFADASADDRARACIDAATASLLPPGASVEGEAGWFVCPPVSAKIILKEWI